MILACALLLLPLQSPKDSITLTDALRQARSQRAQTSLAAALVAQARGAFRTAGAIPNPSLSYSHSAAVPANHLVVDQPLELVAPPVE